MFTTEECEISDFKEAALLLLSKRKILLKRKRLS